MNPVFSTREGTIIYTCESGCRVLSLAMVVAEDLAAGKISPAEAVELLLMMVAYLNGVAIGHKIVIDTLKRLSGEREAA